MTCVTWNRAIVWWSLIQTRSTFPLLFIEAVFFCLSLRKNLSCDFYACFCLFHYLACSTLFDFLRWFLFFLSYRGIAEVRLYAMMAAAFGILLASPVGEKAALRVLIQMSWLESHVTPDGSMKRWHLTASSNGNGVRGYDTFDLWVEMNEVYQRWYTTLLYFFGMKPLIRLL